MLKFKNFFEARRNPEENPREIPLETIKQYMNDDSYFISMRTLITNNRSADKYEDIDYAKDRKHHSKPSHKIGINPKSVYTTPNGIYTYRLVDVKDVILSNDNGLDNLPFMGKAPFIYLLKNKVEDRTMLLHKIQEDDVVEIFNKYIKNFPNSKLKFINENDVDDIKNSEEALNVLRSLIKNGISIKNLDQEIIDKIINKKYNNLHEYLEFYMYNPIKGIIKKHFIVNYMFEPAFDEAFFKNFTGVKNSHIWTVDLIQDALNNFVQDFIIQFKVEMNKRSDSKEITGQYIYNLGKEHAGKNNLAGGIYWWFTYILADGSIHKSENKEPNNNVWNKVIRDTGFDVVVDIGNGIIHKNEPTQAVFLIKQAFDVVKVIGNYKPSGKTKKE